MNVTHLLLPEKKICRKETLKKCTSFEEQKVTRYVWGNVCFGIIAFSCFSSTNPCLIFFKTSFTWEMRSFGNEVDFRDIMNGSPNILAKN